MRPAGLSRPAVLAVASIGVHGAAAALLLVDVAWWPWVVATLVLNHALIAAAGLCPRCDWLGPNLVRLPEACVRRGEVALTFDDGPDPAVTPQVLDMLAAHGAHATFFCIGERAQRWPQLVQRMIAEGHRVENHGQHHPVLAAVSTPAGWRAEVADGARTLTALSGRPPRYYRAVAGLRNPFLQPVLRRQRLRLASWTRRGYDTRTRDPGRVLQRLTRGLAAGDILLLHDGHAAHTRAGRPVVLEVLPQLLVWLAGRGLRAVPLPDPEC